MSGDITGTRIYNAKEASLLLQIQNSTLRKYCQILEKAGYCMHKNEHGHRGFFDHDVIALRKLIELTQNPDMTLESAANVVVATHIGRPVSSTDTKKTTEISVTATVTAEEFETFKQQQAALMYELVKKQEEAAQQQREFQERLWARLENRDMSLLQTIRELQETKLQIAAENKKKWWQFWK
ncbi:DUF3967 domain-containing protein [Ectobacillus antri]|uniref:DUF3967 domain-containing protein n=1 Tax=Ectobacillus antri TaxID=2486280 RepID=UPI001FEA796A|nr:DUF3967 domain-containing protein [Ectobacillus antri]